MSDDNTEIVRNLSDVVHRLLVLRNEWRASAESSRAQVEELQGDDRHVTKMREWLTTQARQCDRLADRIDNEVLKGSK